MKLRVTGLFMASMLCTTAVGSALAQQQQQAAEGDAQSCQQLQTVVQQNEDTFQQVWLDEASTAAQAGDPQLCAQYVAQAEQATAQAEGGEAERIEGRIVVSQEPPQVAVEQPAPEISVTQPEPRVSVTQPQPEIIVRQVPPTIRIEMPEPVVTIDQPQPEIIVRMPDPQVAVETAEPQIEVNQAQPRVSVQQSEPQVDVAVEDTPDQQQQPEVSVQQGTPQVRLQQQQGEAQVEVQQGQPRVTYEAAEPRVEFSGGNQPQVQFTESGEPNVSFVGADGQPQQQGQQQGQQLTEEQRAAQQQQAGQQQGQQLTAEQQAAQQQAGQQLTAEQQAAQQQAGQQEAGAGAAWRGDRQPMTPPNVQVEGYQPVEPASLSVENLTGADVYGAENESIGTVEDVIASQQGQVEYFVLDIGGFLGMGTHRIALGVDEVTVLRADGDDLQAHVGATREQLEQMPEYEG